MRLGKPLRFGNGDCLYREHRASSTVDDRDDLASEQARPRSQRVRGSRAVGVPFAPNAGGAQPRTSNITPRGSTNLTTGVCTFPKDIENIAGATLGRARCTAL